MYINDASITGNINFNDQPIFLMGLGRLHVDDILKNENNST